MRKHGKARDTGCRLRSRPQSADDESAGMSKSELEDLSSWGASGREGPEQNPERESGMGGQVCDPGPREVHENEAAGGESA